MTSKLSPDGVSQLLWKTSRTPQKDEARTVAGSLGVSLVSAAVSTCGGLVGLHTWTTSDFVRGAPHVMGNGAGYNMQTFAGLFCFCFLLPLGVVKALHFSSQLFSFRVHDAKHPWMPLARAATFSILLFLSIAAAALAYTHMAADVLSCGIVFCVNLADTTPAGKLQPNGAPWNGMTNAIGSVLFFAALLVAAAECLLTWRTLSLYFATRSQSGREATQGALREPLLPRPLPSHAARGIYGGWCTPAVLVLVFALLLPAFVVLCMYLPNSWQKLTAAGIDAGAAAGIGPSSLPERPAARMATHAWKATQGVVLKAYPDLVAFYLFVYAVVAVAVAAKLSPAVHTSLLHRPAWLRGPLRGTAVGTVLLLAGLCALLVTWFTYWLGNHAWGGSTNKVFLESLARTLGQSASLVMGLLLLPVSRNSVWTHLFGLPWEAAIVYHTYLGYTFLSFTTLHMLCWWGVYSWGGKCDPRGLDRSILPHGDPSDCSSLPHDILAVPMYYPSNVAAFNPVYPVKPHADNFTIPLATVTWMVLALCMGVLSYHTVRRRHFEVFYYSHHAFLLVFATVLIHAPSSWYYLAPGLLLWLADRCIRFHRSNQVVTVVSMKAEDEITRIAVAVPPAAHPCGPASLCPLASLFARPRSTAASKEAGEAPRPALGPLRHGTGQYVFLNVPCISALQWHPFSISSAPSDPHTTFHIKNMGEGTFTGSLHDLAKEALESGRMPTINIDGPYGLPIDHRRYDQVLLVAGGIGVTPVHSTFRGLYHLAQAGLTSPGLHVKALWVARFPALFRDIAEDILREVQSDDLGGRFAMDLFVNDPTHTHDSEEGGPSSIAFKREIPDIAAELRAMGPRGERTLVFVCGPPGLSAACQAAALHANVHFHTETFAL